MIDEHSRFLPCLACPIDGARLMPAAAGDALRCDNGHSFDRAREGYFNLLVVQHKASRDPGDAKEMVAARRRFLDGGHYAPIATRVSAMVGAELGARGADRATTILDAGCGEGYYLGHLMQSVKPQHPVACAGIDISKWAVRSAAKRNRDILWAVASNRHLPFAQSSIDVVLSMFGFPLWDAFARVQPPDGVALLVDPAPDHLIELRRIIYGEVRQSPPPSLRAAEAAGYRLVDEQRLRFAVVLKSPAAIADLLAMTPHDHRAPLAGREALARLARLDVTAEVSFRLLRRGQH